MVPSAETVLSFCQLKFDLTKGFRNCLFDGWKLVCKKEKKSALPYTTAHCRGPRILHLWTWSLTVEWLKLQISVLVCVFFYFLDHDIMAHCGLTDYCLLYRQIVCSYSWASVINYSQPLFIAWPDIFIYIFCCCSLHCGASFSCNNVTARKPLGFFPICSP